VKPFWVFGIEISVQNYVGSFEYGVLFPLFNLSVILNIFLDLGINNYNNRAVSQDNKLVYNYLPNIVVVKCILAVIYFMLVFGIAFIVGYNKRQMILLVLLVINQFANTFLFYFRSNLSGMQYYTTDSLLSVIDRLIMIALCMVAYWNNFWGMPVTIENFILTQTFSYLIGFIIIAWVFFTKTGKIAFRINWKLSFSIVKAGIPFAILIFLMAAYSRIDAVMIERLLPDGKIQAGTYAQSFRILDAAVMMGVLFAGLLFPMFSSMLSAGTFIGSLFKLSFNLLLVIYMAFALSCAFYSDEIIGVLYHDGGMVSAKVFSILILAIIPMAVIHIFGTLLTAHGNLKVLNRIALFSVLLNIGLNLFLIPDLKCIGAAISCVITQLVAAILQVLAVKKKFGTVFVKPLRIMLFFIVSPCIAWVLSRFSIGWFSAFILTGSLIAILGVVIGLLPFNEIMGLFKRYMVAKP
jgi:O-antigen/teichoic acid export membrane protein